MSENGGRYAAFLLYVDDWLSSTAISLMTPEQEGAYLRLLLHAWKEPDCGLPDDDRLLAKLSRLFRRFKSQNRDSIRAQFFAKDEGRRRERDAEVDAGIKRRARFTLSPAAHSDLF